MILGDNMQNFIISFNVVFPIFILISLGYALKCTGLLKGETVKNMNSIVFKVFLPVMLLKNVYDSNISAVFDAKLIIFSVSCVLLSVIILLLTVPRFEKINSKRGVLIQGMFRSNFVILGLPVAEALCGDSATGTAAILVSIIVPIFNFMAVITLEIFNGNNPNFKKIIKEIISNPLIIASVCGLLLLFSGIKFPLIIESILDDISGITTPVALMMLGASINFKSIGENAIRLIAGVSVKLIILPALFLCAAILIFGFSGDNIAILLALFATPPAVSSFTMAQQMGGDEDLAGLLVMFGSAISVITMFIWVFVLMQAGIL